MATLRRLVFCCSLALSSSTLRLTCASLSTGATTTTATAAATSSFFLGKSGVGVFRGLHTLLVPDSNNNQQQQQQPFVAQLTQGVDVNGNGFVVDDKGKEKSKEASSTTTGTIATGTTAGTTTGTTTAPMDEVSRVMNQYKNKLVRLSLPEFPHCDIYLCGTLHVAKASSAMIADVITALQPHYVVVEVCESRIDSLFEEETPVMSLREVLQESVQQRSVKVLGMGLLSWIQLKAASLLGSRLGGEISTAYRVACQQGVYGVVLGDRAYAVTIQRALDRLSLLEKVKVGAIMLYEAVTLSLGKLTDYINRSEADDGFVVEEMKTFRALMPGFASVIIDERDEYIAQTIIELARVGFAGVPENFDFSANNNNNNNGSSSKGRVLVVVGAGHLQGVSSVLTAGGVSEERVNEISRSSKHSDSSWPGRGVLQMVDTYNHNNKEKENNSNNNKEKENNNKEKETLTPPSPPQQ